MATLSSVAQQKDYLTIREANGNEYSIASVGTKITFSDGKMNLVYGKESKTYDVAQLSTLFFSATPTAISHIPSSSNLEVGIVNGTVRTNAPASAVIRVYTPDGRQTGLQGLPAGMYIIRIDNETYKVIAR